MARAHPLPSRSPCLEVTNARMYRETGDHQGLSATPSTLPLPISRPMLPVPCRARQQREWVAQRRRWRRVAAHGPGGRCCPGRMHQCTALWAFCERRPPRPARAPSVGAPCLPAGERLCPLAVARGAYAQNEARLVATERGWHMPPGGMPGAAATACASLAARGTSLPTTARGSTPPRPPRAVLQSGRDAFSRCNGGSTVASPPLQGSWPEQLRSMVAPPAALGMLSTGRPVVAVSLTLDHKKWGSMFE